METSQSSSAVLSTTNGDYERNGGESHLESSTGHGLAGSGGMTNLPHSHSHQPMAHDQPFGAPIPPTMPHPQNTNFQPSSGADVQRNKTLNNKIDSIKSWGVNTFKCTKQLVNEKLGKGSRTVDHELDSEIARIRDTQQRYAQLLQLARNLSAQFSSILQTQKYLAEQFQDLSTKQPELQQEFASNSDTQRVLSKNGEALLGALNFFTSGLNTVVAKTIEDTIFTIKRYEQSRVEYDAYRNDFEVVANAPQDPLTIPKRDQAFQDLSNHKSKYEQLREDVQVKLKFLDENRIKVMHKQLVGFNQAITAYFSGNDKALQDTLQQYSIKLKQPNSALPSFLEK